MIIRCPCNGSGKTDGVTITGAAVEHREGYALVTVFTAAGWLVWLCDPSTGTRTIVEQVDVGQPALRLRADR